MIRNLIARVGSFEVVWDHAEIEKGQIVALTGPSGSGKSTLLHSIAGFLSAPRSSIQLDGKFVDHLPPEKRNIALVFQRASLFPHLTISENVEFPLKIQGVSRAERNRRAARWLQRLQMSELAHRRVTEVSQGQAQRIALARACITGFRALLLDEPFSALDQTTRVSMRTILAELVRETQMSAIMVTHFLDDAEAIADRCLEIQTHSKTYFVTRRPPG